MSFQAYLDRIEEKTGRTPAELVALAQERGYDASTKANVVVGWLHEEFGLGRGHAMALVHVIKNGARIGDEHVGTTGAHRDESAVLRLDGKEHRSAP
jgi:cyanate permease